MHQEVDGVLEGTWLELVSIVNDNHRGLVVIIRNESSHFSPPIRRRYFITPGVALRVFLQPQRSHNRHELANVLIDVLVKCRLNILKIPNAGSSGSC